MKLRRVVSSVFWGGNLMRILSNKSVVVRKDLSTLKSPTSLDNPQKSTNMAVIDLLYPPISIATPSSAVSSRLWNKKPAIFSLLYFAKFRNVLITFLVPEPYGPTKHNSLQSLSVPETALSRPEVCSDEGTCHQHHKLIK